MYEAFCRFYPMAAVNYDICILKCIGYFHHLCNQADRAVHRLCNQGRFGRGSDHIYWHNAVQRNRHNSQSDINYDYYLWCSWAVFIAANPSLNGALEGKLAHLFRVVTTSVSHRWQFCPQEAGF